MQPDLKDMFSNYFDSWVKDIIDKQIDKKLKDSLFFVDKADMENFVVRTVDKLFDSHMAAYTHHVKGETIFDVPGLTKELKAIALEAAGEEMHQHEEQYDHELIHEYHSHEQVRQTARDELRTIVKNASAYLQI